MLISAETPEDIEAIRTIQRAAFGRDYEADLVDSLRGDVEPFVSLVARIDDKPVGHILFTPVALPGTHDITILSVAPIAVLPDYQGDGVGSELVHEGLVMCEHEGVDGVVALGGRDFYPRFGFQPAADFGLRTNFPVMQEEFLARELTKDAFSEAEGTVEYPPQFQQR
ncbi:MAG: N-acetyltransferase [Gammaproteobacteria bacterium]|nr:N-acetyltransferase [Gammaproteobacteria bacterium]